MTLSPIPYQMLAQPLDDQPRCEESMFLDESWKSSFDNGQHSEDSNVSLPDLVPQSLYPPCYGPITGSNEILGGQVNTQRWRNKNPITWDPLDVAYWIQAYSESSFATNDLRAEAFSGIDGATMSRMRVEQFEEREPFHGRGVYMAFQNLLLLHPPQCQPATFIEPVPNYQESENLESIDIEGYINMNNISFDGSDTFRSLPSFASLAARSQQTQAAAQPPSTEVESVDESSDSPPASPASSDDSSSTESRPTRRGRSKGKLWEFVLKLLLDKETNPDIIKWEDRKNGVFRIVRSEEVARLWGVRKSNPTMTYEKMSRAMRYYYRKDILERIDGRRLVYKFGATSRGWQL